MKKIRFLKKNIRKKKSPKKLILILFLFLTLIVLVNKKVIPTVYKKSKIEINKFATNVINDSITQAINEFGYNYDDYVTIKTTKEGNIIAIYTNAKQITLIHNKIVDLINKKLENCKNQYVYVALGSLTGLVWFASKGPSIPIRIYSKGITNSEIYSDLQESGVNQTLHKIHIKVYVDIAGFLPFHCETVRSQSDCMLAESLIVGNVPQHYTKVISGEKTDIANDAYKYNE